MITMIVPKVGQCAYINCALISYLRYDPCRPTSSCSRRWPWRSQFILCIVQPVSYKRYFRRNNCFLLLVYTINLSLSTDLVDLPPMGTFYMKHALQYICTLSGWGINSCNEPSQIISNDRSFVNTYSRIVSLSCYS